MLMVLGAASHPDTLPASLQVSEVQSDILEENEENIETQPVSPAATYATTSGPLRDP